MWRNLAIICLLVLIVCASPAPAHAQLLNFMMDVISTGTRFNRVEPGGAVSGTVQSFEDFMTGIRREAVSGGISPELVERAFAGLTPDEWVL
jgi:membrane-bound lytic murein transglycosylase B